MTARTIKHALTRFLTWALVGGGVALMVTQGWIVVGGVVAGLGALNFFRVASNRELDGELALQEQAKAHGVRRRLTYREKRVMGQINAYAHRLEQQALEPGLGLEMRAEAWKLVREERGVDATETLEKFLADLPALDEEVGPLDELAPVKSLSARIHQDLERRRKIDQELDALS